MLPAQTILVPLDGSSFGESSLVHARAVARALDSRLHLVTVLDPSRSGATASRSAECRLQLIETRNYLERLAREMERDGLEASLETREGDPAHEVREAARERRAGLVVLATRPRRRDERLLSRGVAQELIASADVSLLVARGASDGRRWDRDASTYGRIAVGVDGSPGSRRALRLAAAVARSEGASLVLVHVSTAGGGATPGRDGRSGPGTDADADAVGPSAEERYLGRLGRRIACTGTEVETVLRSSRRVAETVERAAEEAGADLLVLGARGAGEAGSRYGGCSRRLLLHSEVPLLVVREEERRSSRRAPRSTLHERRRTRHIRGGSRYGPPVDAGDSTGTHHERTRR